MARRQVTIFINGREVVNQVKNIYAEKRKITAELNRMAIGSEEYMSKMDELKEVNGLLQKHRDGIRGTESSWAKMSAGATRFLGAAGIAFGADMIIDYGRRLFRVGVEMDTLARKANTVLGPSLGFVTSEAERHANAMGLTNAQYTAAVTNIADMLKPMGFTTEEAAKQAVEMQNLAGALSEWTGGQFSAEEVSISFRKALVGEREELERYGISIKQSDVNTRLAEMGMAKLTGQALKQAEAMATLQLIVESSTDAQIGFNQNADTAVRRQAELAAQITEITERISLIMLPVFERVVSAIDTLSQGALALISTFEGIVDPASAATTALAAQQSTVSALESELPALLARYQEIKDSKVEEEQQELAEVIQRIGELTPTAITQIDEYGRVLGISAEKSQEFLDNERARLEFVNAEAIQAIENETQAIQRQIEARQKQIEAGGLVRFSPQGQRYVERNTADEIREIITEVENLQVRLQGAQAELARLKGQDLTPDQPDTQNQESPTEEEIRQQELRAKALEEQRRKQAEKEQERLEKRREKLLETIEKFQELERLSELNAEDRKLAELAAKYDEQIKEAASLEAKGVRDATAQRLELERLKQQALDELRTQQLQEAFEKEQQLQDELDQERNLRELERMEAKKEADRVIAEELRQAVFTEQEQALFDLEQHYNSLIALAQQYGIETLDIEIAYARERQRILDEFQKEDQEKFIEAQQQKAEALAEAFRAMSSVIQGALDLATAAGIENTAFGKLLAIAQVGLSSAEAIAKATASAAGVPFPGNLIAIGTAVGAVLSNIARATSIIQGVQVPQKKEGGWMTANGADDGISYRAKYIGSPQTGMLDYDHPVLISSAAGMPVLANERGREFFVSNQALKNPVVANYARLIDNIQRGRTIQRVEGGFVDPLSPNPGGPSGATGPQFGNDPGANAALISAINQLTSILSQGIYAVVDDDQVIEIWKKQNFFNQISGGTLGN